MDTNSGKQAYDLAQLLWPLNRTLISNDTSKTISILISEFEKLTGVPILVNTSFNIRSEPIVESPLDAWNCFMGTDLDILIIGNFLLQKSEQSQELIRSYRDSFNLD